jgi:phage/conjugal plasmid C-4 type zinc finger TraR family protein
MADDIDLAQELDEAIRQGALAARRSEPAYLDLPFPRDCMDCGEDIPANRHAAMPNALFCRDCQAHLERRRR